MRGYGNQFILQMLIFVKKRNKSEPMELVPWKSTNIVQNKKDLQVPLRATTMTLFFLLIYLALLSIIFKSSETWDVIGYAHVITGLPLPLMLIFTIKQKNSSQNGVSLQPPSNLQFHENVSAGMNLELLIFPYVYLRP